MAWEAIGHIVLAVSGLLPVTILGITITPTLNTIPIIISTLLSFF